MNPHFTSKVYSIKTCTTCSESKPSTTEYFTKNKNRNDGFSPQCKDCQRVYRDKNKERIALSKQNYYEVNKGHLSELAKERYQGNKEYIKEKSKKWRKDNPEYITNYDRDYRETNRSKINEYMISYRLRKQKDKPARKTLTPDERASKTRERKRNYYRNNKDKFRGYQRKWRSNNLEKVRASVRERKAMKRNAEGTHTAADVRAQYARQNGCCHYCAAKVGEKYHVDHVVPLSRGGSNGPENLVIACPFCNQSKNNKMPHEWPEGGRLL